MKLYNLTLQRPTGITHAVHGNFSGVKLQEIVVSRGRILELLKPDPNNGKVHTLFYFNGLLSHLFTLFVLVSCQSPHLPSVTATLINTKICTMRP